MTDTDSLTPLSCRYHRSKLLTLPHGMFNRLDGSSLPPFSSFNVSYGVGDDPATVDANRQRLKKTLAVLFLVSAQQMHGNRIYCAADISADTEVAGYDALITNQPGVGLLIQQADCQAVLMHDPDKKVIAAVHCGWRGSAVNIIGLTIAEMQRRYRTDPAALRVAVSPSLGPCCAEFINYRKELPRQLQQFRESGNHFNFWDISASQLIAAGVKAKRIDIARICTACDHDYFSYRRAKKRREATTGRNGSAICLPMK